MEGSRDHPQMPSAGTSWGCAWRPRPLSSPPDRTQGGRSSAGAAATGAALHRRQDESSLTTHCRESSIQEQGPESWSSTSPRGPGLASTPEGREDARRSRGPRTASSHLRSSRSHHLQELSSQCCPPSVLSPLFSWKTGRLFSSPETRAGWGLSEPGTVHVTWAGRGGGRGWGKLGGGGSQQLGWEQLGPWPLTLKFKTPPPSSNPTTGRTT